MKITDEMVEAGLKSLDVPHWVDMTVEDDVRAVLEAVAPLIAAKALRDAAVGWEGLVQREIPPVRGSVWLNRRADRIEAKP